MTKNFEEVAETWIELCNFEQDTNEYESRFWAWEALNGCVYDEPDIAWSIILMILEKTDSEKVIGNLGAGPLEHMMCQNDRFTLDKIENEFNDNKKLKECMTHVWLDKEDTGLYKTFYDLVGLEPPFEN